MIIENEIKKEDKRIVKTKQKMCEALLILMKDEPLDEIKISKLCQVSNISRATFYNNFKTVYDVLDCYLDLLKTQMSELYRVKMRSKKNTVQEAMLYLLTESFDYLLDKREIILSFMENNVGRNLTQMISNFMKSTISNILREHENEIRQQLTVSIEYASSFLSGGISFLVLDYLINTNVEVDKTEFLNNLISICNKIVKFGDNK